MRRGILHGFYMQIYTTRDMYKLTHGRFLFIYMNVYWLNKPQYGHAGKPIVANCSVISITLYLVGIVAPNSKHTAAAEEKFHQAELTSMQHCIAAIYL